MIARETSRQKSNIGAQSCHEQVVDSSCVAISFIASTQKSSEVLESLRKQLGFSVVIAVPIDAADFLFS